MDTSPTHMLLNLKSRCELNGTLGTLVPCGAEQAARGRVGFRTESRNVVLCVPASCARRLDRAKLEEMRDDCCPICLEPMRVVQSKLLRCGHALHIGCSEQMVRSSSAAQGLRSLIGAAPRNEDPIVIGYIDLEAAFLEATRCPICRTPDSLETFRQLMPPTDGVTLLVSGQKN